MSDNIKYPKATPEAMEKRFPLFVPPVPRDWTDKAKLMADMDRARARTNLLRDKWPTHEVFGFTMEDAASPERLALAYRVGRLLLNEGDKLHPDFVDKVHMRTGGDDPIYEGKSMFEKAMIAFYKRTGFHFGHVVVEPEGSPHNKQVAELLYVLMHHLEYIERAFVRQTEDTNWPEMGVEAGIKTSAGISQAALMSCAPAWKRQAIFGFTCCIGSVLVARPARVPHMVEQMYATESATQVAERGTAQLLSRHASVAIGEWAADDDTPPFLRPHLERIQRALDEAASPDEAQAILEEVLPEVAKALEESGYDVDIKTMLMGPGFGTNPSPFEA